MEGIAQTVFFLLLFSFFCLTVVINARHGKFCDAIFFAAMTFGIILLGNQVLLEFPDVLLVKWREVDLLVEEADKGVTGHRCLTTFSYYRPHRGQ